MVLALLGLRRKPDPQPFLDYVRSHPPRWEGDEVPPSPPQTIRWSADYLVVDKQVGVVRFFLKNGPCEYSIPLADWVKNIPGEPRYLREWADYMAAGFHRMGLYG
jgi:hypothetical protein